MDRDIIFKTRVGSHLYGLNNENSDEDFFGVYMPSMREIYGFGDKNSNLDMSIISKDENGKNTKDAVDDKYISLHSLFKLLKTGSPAIIEILYSDDLNTCITSEIWKSIEENKQIFMNSSWINGFLGFSRKQKLKLMNTPAKKECLYKAISFLETIERRKDPLIQFENMEGFNKIFHIVSKNDNVSYEIEGLPFRVLRTNTVAKTIKTLKRKITFSNRDYLINKYGYDCKSASHLIRLLYECRDILRYRKIVFPFGEKEKNILIAIKNGEWKIDDVLLYADDLEENIKKLNKIMPLPNMSENNDKCEELLIDIMKKYFKEA